MGIASPQLRSLWAVLCAHLLVFISVISFPFTSPLRPRQTLKWRPPPSPQRRVPPPLPLWPIAAGSGFSPASSTSTSTLPRHPFDSSKWGRICRFLINGGVLKKEQIVEPLEASKDDLLVVHSEDYLKSLNSSLNVAMIVEVPPVALLPNCLVQKNVLYPFRKQVGGTILAAKLAMERRWAINIGGGFHHCSDKRGGGFCAYADISLCIRFASVRLNISRVMIIDLDAHQGNGHELDFAKESEEGTIYILDMYNAHIYPFDFKAKESIRGKVELESGTNTEEYMEKLEKALKDANAFDPDLIVYNAGTDILDGDPLGHLKVTPDGVIARDERVFRFAKMKCKPLVMVTSGGYMKSNAEVIAKSIRNLYEKNLIDLSIPQG